MNYKIGEGAERDNSGTKTGSEGSKFNKQPKRVHYYNDRSR